MIGETRSRKLLSIIEQAFGLLIWLSLIVGLFYPWEEFADPETNRLGETRVGGFGTTRVVFFLLTAGVVLLCLIRWKSLLRTLLLAWPLLILCGWILLSASWSPDSISSFNTAGRFLVVVVFSSYMACRYDSVQFVGALTKGFAIAAAASLTIMVLDPELGYSHQVGDYATAWRGAFTHKNWLGAAMSLGILVSGYSYIVRANHRLLSAVTFLGCLFLLIMSRSVTAIVATFLSFVVAMMGGAIQSQRTPVLRAFALIGLVVVVAFLIVLPLIDINLFDLPTFAGRSNTLTGRTGIWRAVWTAIQKHPFIGYGYGFWTVPSVARNNIWLAVNWDAPHAHNTWLDAALQLGLVGVVLVAVIWLTAFGRAVWLVFARYGHGALFYLTILVNCLARSVTETIIFSPALQALFWLVTSYIFVARIARQRDAATQPIGPNAARGVATVHMS